MHINKIRNLLQNKNINIKKTIYRNDIGINNEFHEIFNIQNNILLLNDSTISDINRFKKCNLLKFNEKKIYLLFKSIPNFKIYLPENVEELVIVFEVENKDVSNINFSNIFVNYYDINIDNFYLINEKPNTKVKINIYNNVNEISFLEHITINKLLLEDKKLKKLVFLNTRIKNLNLKKSSVKRLLIVNNEIGKIYIKLLESFENIEELVVSKDFISSNKDTLLENFINKKLKCNKLFLENVHFKTLFLKEFNDVNIKVSKIDTLEVININKLNITDIISSNIKLENINNLYINYTPDKFYLYSELLKINKISINNINNLELNLFYIYDIIKYIKINNIKNFKLKILVEDLFYLDKDNFKLFLNLCDNLYKKINHFFSNSNNFSIETVINLKDNNLKNKILKIISIFNNKKLKKKNIKELLFQILKKDLKYIIEKNYDFPLFIEDIIKEKKLEKKFIIHNI